MGTVRSNRSHTVRSTRFHTVRSTRVPGGETTWSS